MYRSSASLRQAQSAYPGVPAGISPERIFACCSSHHGHITFGSRKIGHTVRLAGDEVDDDRRREPEEHGPRPPLL